MHSMPYVIYHLTIGQELRAHARTLSALGVFCFSLISDTVFYIGFVCQSSIWTQTRMRDSRAFILW